MEVRQETILRRELEGMQGKGEDLVRAGRGRAVMLVVVAEVVVTVVAVVAAGLFPGSREMVEMLGKSK